MLACMYVCNYVGMDVCCGDSENFSDSFKCVPVLTKWSLV